MRRRRLAFSRLRDDVAVGRLFTELGPRFKSAPGRLSADPEDRLSARATPRAMAIVQLLDQPAGRARGEGAGRRGHGRREGEREEEDQGGTRRRRRRPPRTRNSSAPAPVALANRRPASFPRGGPFHFARRPPGASETAVSARRPVRVYALPMTAADVYICPRAAAGCARHVVRPPRRRVRAEAAARGRRGRRNLGRVRGLPCRQANGLGQPGQPRIPRRLGRARSAVARRPRGSITVALQIRRLMRPGAGPLGRVALAAEPRRGRDCDRVRRRRDVVRVSILPRAPTFARRRGAAPRVRAGRSRALFARSHRGPQEVVRRARARSRKAGCCRSKAPRPRWW